MSVAATIRRSGASIQWIKMGGSGGTYDFNSARVVAPPAGDPTTIYGVIDGFGSQFSRVVNANQFDGKTLDIDGSFHIFTDTKVLIGDRLVFGGVTYTIFDVKEAWKKNQPVLYMAAVRP